MSIPNFDRFKDEVEHLEVILLDDDSWPEDDEYDAMWEDDHWELEDDDYHLVDEYEVDEGWDNDL